MFDIQFRYEIKRLKNKPDISAAKNCKFFIFQCKYFFSVNKHFARSRRIQRTDHIEKRAFSRAGLSDNCNKLTLRNRKIYLFECVNGGFPLAIGFTDRIYFQ